MPRIYLETKISAPVGIVFDLSRSIDLHKISTEHTKEEAIAGKTSGLIALSETVTWRAKHLGFTQNLTSKITDFNYPFFFADEMAQGAFKEFRHEHHFECHENTTLMIDVFTYQSPLGFFGKLADFVFLKRIPQQSVRKKESYHKGFCRDRKMATSIERKSLTSHDRLVRLWEK